MNEEYRFHSVTLYDLPTYKEFNIGFSQCRTINLLLQLFVLVQIVRYVVQFDNPYMVFMYLLIFAISVAVGLIVRICNRKGSVHYKRALAANYGLPPKHEFGFNDSGIHSLRAGIPTGSGCNYDQIRGVFETKNLLVLTQKHGIGILVNKNNLTGGTPEEFLAYLAERTPKWPRKEVRHGKTARIMNIVLTIAAVIGLILAICNLPGIDLKQRMNDGVINTMSYREVAEKLEPLGITGGTDELFDYLDENYSEYYAFPQLNDYHKSADLLAWLGEGEYDADTGEWTPSQNGVYWHSLEAYDVSCMYTDFLRGIGALAPDKLVFTNITEDHSQVDLDSGEGIISLTFTLNGTEHTLEIEAYQDWYDYYALDDITGIINAENQEMCLFCTSDEADGMLYFYRDNAWADTFERITDLTLYISPFPMLDMYQ